MQFNFQYLQGSPYRGCSPKAREQQHYSCYSSRKLHQQSSATGRISLNKPFKAFVRGAWEDYMLHMCQASSCQTIPTASKDEIVQWTIDAKTCLSEQGNMIPRHSWFVVFQTRLMAARTTLFEFPRSCPISLSHMGPAGTRSPMTHSRQQMENRKGTQTAQIYNF